MEVQRTLSSVWLPARLTRSLMKSKNVQSSLDYLSMYILFYTFIRR